MPDQRSLFRSELRLGPFTFPGAGISADEVYRYWLSRAWDLKKELLVWLMLNPSTADAREDDATIRVVQGFSRRLGFGGFLVGNIFAYRSAHPEDLQLPEDPVGPENDFWTHELLWTPGIAPYVVCAWGDPGAGKRADSVVRAILEAGKEPRALTLTKRGNPGHPLYKRVDLMPKTWRATG